MSTPDHAPAIAAFALESSVATLPHGDFIGELRRHWPGVPSEEIARGLEIALEILEGEIAENKARAPHSCRAAPIPRAVMVEGVATVLLQAQDLADWPGLLDQLGEAYPDLTWSTFMEGVERAEALQRHEGRT